MLIRIFRRPDGRYYAVCEPIQDLFGDRILITYHGTKYSKMGGIKTYFSETDEAITEIEKIVIKTRLAHGYQEC